LESDCKLPTVSATNYHMNINPTQINLTTILRWLVFSIDEKLKHWCMPDQMER
jgi:hypothetical protein